MEKENKTSRASQTRSKSERPKVWVPPSSLDAPPAPDGFRYRWIRAEVQGFQDTKNITGRLREGYELVRSEEVENASDYPVVEDGKYKGVVGVGGLLLAKVPVEIAQQRQEYMANRHKQQDEAVNNDLMKEQDKRIRVDFPHKFGNTENKQSAAPVQTVASAKRSVKPGRKTVRLTSSQVAIAKKLGVPLEEYAKQLKITKEV